MTLNSATITMAVMRYDALSQRHRAYIKPGRYYMSIAGRTDFNDVTLLASLETETPTPPLRQRKTT